MPERYDERHRDMQRQGRGYGRDDRGFVERAGDEVRSWMGDDEAERRRRMDAVEDDRDRERERWTERDTDYRRPTRGDVGWSGERGGVGTRPPERLSPATRFETGYGGSYGYGSAPGYAATSSYGTERRGGEGDWRQEWRGAGAFQGRGPKGYQRSDERIREDVCDRLADSPDVDASEIEVNVSAGEVTLTGSVQDRESKRRSEDLVESISGVREVHNQLRVSRGNGSTSVTTLGLSDATNVGAGPSSSSTTEPGSKTTATVGAAGQTKRS